MVAIKKVLKSIENAGFDDIGVVVEAGPGHWVIGDEDILPVQLERLADGESYLLYATVVRKTAEPVYIPFIKTLFMEQLMGHCLGRYGICAGPVTITLYQKITICSPASAERLAATIACHRMLMDCYIEGNIDLDDDAYLPVSQNETAMVIPFCH